MTTRETSMTTRYSDDDRAKAKALFDASQAAWDVLDTFEEENADKIAEIETKYEPMRKALHERHEKEWTEMAQRHEREIIAIEDEVRKGTGTHDLYQAAQAAEQAYHDGPLTFETDHVGEPIACATSGKPIACDEETVEGEDGKLSIAAEVPETAAA